MYVYIRIKKASTNIHFCVESKVVLYREREGGKYKISWVDRKKSFDMLNHRSKIIFPPLLPLPFPPVNYSPRGPPPPYFPSRKLEPKTL